MTWLFRLAAIAIAAGAALSTANPQSAAPEWRHAASLFGSIKYPADFKHFDYVNPHAPKGGTVRLSALGTFDNLNAVVAGVKGSLAAGLDLTSETLMTASLDEVSTEYGLIAESLRYPPDFSSVTYRLRPQAKWHDGKPITPEDVIYSLDVFKANSPMFAAYYRHVVKAEKTGEREVTFTFDAPGNRELPQIVGQLTILPKHWWEGTDRNGRKRDVTATTLEPPLGSGPYRIKSFEPGRNIVYERVPDYWGKDLAVNVGRDNFDQVRYEYFRDPTVALEAFKADQIDFRTESSAKAWATAYDFPAVRDKRVALEEFPVRNVGRMQGFVFNTRRDKFKDPRVRQAFNYAFDFEEMNKQMFYGQYRRIDSYFEGTELAWNWRPNGEGSGEAAAFTAPPAAEDGLPQGLEREILEAVRDKVPAEVFTTPFKNPVGGNPQATRSNLREALRLMREAGWIVRDHKLVNAKTGEPFTVEFLDNDPNSERLNLFYKPSLERLGITVTVRTVDDSQYENRLRNWDFDIITAVWPESLSPGNEQRDYWSSAAADRPGSRNYAGIRNPAVDALIERIIYAKDRAELVAATRALDRVLLWNHYVVPQFTYDKARTARWDRFARPEKMPIYGIAAFPTIWWWDGTRAAKTGRQP
ncbi:MAG TPA: extracellular solute-binding protein [Xanthobacteraceae bacterium]|nr:extracellular solute-binding protein [Xanthobacteraceae bacterium]